jgi:prevent-host-death family protein
MSTVTLEEAQSHLAELIDQLQPGQEITITRDNQPVAKLTSQVKASRPPRRPGTLRGTVLYMAPDFNAPLDEFKEYME